MTAPPDEKGYDASIQALLNAFPMADKMAAMYAEAAIRAYLAASPSPSEMDVARKLRERSGFMREAGHDDDAELDLEAADALDQAQSALAAMRADRDSLQAALNGVRDNRDGLLVAAEAQVQRLTEENEALREKSDEFETGLVDFHRELSAAEARIKALEEALGNVLSHVSDTLGCGRHCVIEAEAEDEAEYTTAIQAARSTLKENAL